MVKAIEDLVETTNSVDTISAMTHIPLSRFHGELKETTFEYEEILSIIYEAMSPFRAYIDNVDDAEEDRRDTGIRTCVRLINSIVNC